MRTPVALLTSVVFLTTLAAAQAEAGAAPRSQDR